MINNHYRRHDENRRLIIQDPNDDEDAEYCDRLEWLTTAVLLIKTGQQRLLILLEMELKYDADYDSMDTWIWWMKKGIVNKNETIIMRC